MLKEFVFFSVICILLTLLCSELHAQNIIETTKPDITEPSERINYDETSSLFWNSRFRAGQGLISFNAAEFLLFEALDEKKNPETHHADVFDCFSGLNVGGVIYEGFLLTFEADISNHQVKKTYADKYQNFRLGISFDADLLYGLSILKSFTLVAKAGFRVWDNATDNHPAMPEGVDKIESNGYLLRTEIYTYFEIFNFNNAFALNVFAGAGYHYYKVIEKELGTEYKPPCDDDADLILGCNFIFAKNFEVNFAIYVIGVFTFCLNFSYFS